MAVDYLAQTVASGIAPLELEYYPVKNTSRKELCGLRSVLKINSIDLGPLYPAQYRVVANRNQQCSRLAAWSFRSLMETFLSADPLQPLPETVSVYFPTRMLMKDREGLPKLIAAAKEHEALFPRVCFECSSDLLLEDPATVRGKMEQYRALGFRFLLSDFGDPFCPLARLEGLPFDAVLLDDSLASVAAISTVSARSAIQLVTGLGMVAVLPPTEDEELISAAFSCGCAEYIDSRPGAFSEVIR